MEEDGADVADVVAAGEEGGDAFVVEGGVVTIKKLNNAVLSTSYGLIR